MADYACIQVIRPGDLPNLLCSNVYGFTLVALLALFIALVALSALVALMALVALLALSALVVVLALSALVVLVALLVLVALARSDRQTKNCFNYGGLNLWCNIYTYVGM